MPRIPILLSYCILTAHTCIPMNPGEELECPSPPKVPRLRPNTSDVEYSDLRGPETNYDDEEAGIYDCPFKMFAQGAEVGASNKWELVCKPNSGFFVLRDTKTRKETLPNPKTTFACVEDTCNPANLEYEGNVAPPYVDGIPIEIDRGAEKSTATCPKGSQLYMFTDDGPVLVEEKDVPTCARDSGTWGSCAKKVFKCLRKSCNPPIVATTNTQYCPPMSTCDPTKLNPMPTTLIRQVFWHSYYIVGICADGLSVSYIEMGDTDPPVLVKELRCDTEQGLWKPTIGEFDVLQPQVTCGKPSMCKSCEAPMVLDPTNDLCKNPKSYFCSAKATYVMDPCYTISCAADAKLSVVKADKTITPLAGNAVCEGGMWKVNGAVQNLLPNVVCSKPLNCDKCEAVVKPTYMEQAMYADNVKKMQAGSKCTFTCSKPDTELISATKPYNSITCDAATEKAEFTGGTALAPWSCVKCGCSVGKGMCPGQFICTAPTSTKPCVYSCPAGSEAWYRTTSNGLLASIPAGEYRCQGNKINGLVNYMDGLMCGKPWPAGSPTIVPGFDKCPMVKENTPIKIGGVDVPTRYGDLRYTLEGGMLYLSCLNGVLVSQNPNFITPGQYDRLPCYSDGWLREDFPNSANCIDAKYGISRCLPYLVAGDHYNYECKNGVCTITCKNPNLKMFLYSKNTAGLRIPTKSAVCSGNSRIYTWEGELAVNAAPTATQMQGCFMA